MDARIEELQKWGCDTARALTLMLDDEEFYIKCLRMVPDDPCFAELEQALHAQDVETAFKAAHTLKGVLLNVGLTPLYNQMVEIVEPLRAGHCENMLEKLEALNQMRVRLTNILGEE